MALMARICRNCGTAYPPILPHCEGCGEDGPTVDLIAAYSEQGTKLNEAKDRIAELEERLQKEESK